ncbi:MAG: CotH kinase family protein [Bacteroidales bacterium]|nr:CotH kinase family protein [Bacteroidales bacterium]
MKYRFKTSGFLFFPLILVCCGILLATSCKKNVIQEKTRPQCYEQLLEKYQAGEGYTDLKELQSFVKIFFGNEAVTVNAKDIPFGKVLPQLDKDSFVKASLKDAYPLFMLIEDTGISIFASNGESFFIRNLSYIEKPEEPDKPAEPEQPEEPEEPEQPVKPEYTIPVIHLTTNGGAKIDSKDVYVEGTIKAEDPSCHFSDVAVFESAMQIRGRGNTTWGMPKKPYKIKLPEKAPILGIAKDKEWVLLANYSDKTLLRNATAMQISRVLGFSWTPVMISVNVYLNGEYQGVYTFTEHKKVSKSRVNITEMKATDNEGEAVTGGYYLELENESISEPFFFKTSRYGVTAMSHEPENPSEEQKAYIKQYFEDMEYRLSRIGHSSDYNYEDYIDVNSFVNYYIIEELTKNPDGNFRKSTFLTKDRNKKLELYHVWDFDITMGNCNYWGDQSTNPGGWLMKDCVWFNRLFKDPAYVNAIKKRLNEKYDELWDVQNFILDQVKLLDGEQNHNFQRWPILGQYVWPNAVWYNTYDEEVDYLINFYLGRLEWLKNEVNKL